MDGKQFPFVMESSRDVPVSLYKHLRVLYMLRHTDFKPFILSAVIGRN
jgi:hypothetical protein